MTSLQQWKSTFQRYSNLVPVPENMVEKYSLSMGNSSGKSKTSPSKSAPQTPTSPQRRGLLLHSTSTKTVPSVVYSVLLNTVTGLSVPPLVEDLYLADKKKPLQFGINASLFDMESGRFFGGTYSMQNNINLRKSKESGKSASPTIKTAVQGRALRVDLEELVGLPMKERSNIYI